MKLPDKISYMIKAYQMSHLFNGYIFLRKQKPCFGKAILSQVLLKSKPECLTKFSTEITLTVGKLRSNFMRREFLIILLT